MTDAPAYTYTQPSGGVYADEVSEVRFLVQDTSPSAPHSLTDAEIQYLLARVQRPDGTDNPRMAASLVARRMAVNFRNSALTEKKVGDLLLQYDYSQQSASYDQLADELATDSDIPGNVQALYYDAGPGPFYEGQFDNGGRVRDYPYGYNYGY